MVMYNMPSERRSGAGLLLDTLEGPIRQALLGWALDSGVFDLCETFILPDALARRMDLPPPQLLLTLRALVAADFMQTDGGRFRTAPDILPFVAKDSPRNMVATLRSMADMRHAGLNDIGTLIASATHGGNTRLFDDTHWDASYLSLAAFHRSVAADAMIPCLTSLPEWPDTQNLLEIGPGSAVLARRLLALRPDLSITLFDLPPVIERIAEEAADLPLSLVPGSYNGALPGKCFDVIWCSMTLYFHDQGLPALICRLAEHLAPGGVLLSFHEALTDDRTAPPEHVIGRLMPGLRQRDVSFAEGEIAEAMTAAGLRRPSSDRLSTPFGRFRLDAARKEA